MAQASSTASVKTYHANPLIGSYPFVEDARGFMASNGYAYSYVLFNARVAQVGGTFTMLPALNTNVPSATNFTVVVTYRGEAVNGTQGPSFDFFMPAVGVYVAVTYGNPSTLFGASLPGSNVAFFTVARGTPANMTLFVYVGPDNMPSAIPP